MRKSLIILAFMILSALPTLAQIDLHSHAITKDYLDYIKANGAEMDEGFPIPAWDVEQHIAFMDKAGIQTAVLTMPAPQPWFGDAKASASVCRSYNEECAALKARYPGRFMFCAALPLPDVPHALEEARYALEVLGADGVKLATNSYGQYLADPVFYKGSPVSFVNRAFPGTDLYKPKDMPKEIDFLLISHDHWDHLDYQTVIELKGRVKKVVCPLGVGENFEYWGYDKRQLIELDWYESATFDSLTFHCLPTQHFSGRGFWKSKTMPASWLMESPLRRVFFSGDGGYSSRFKHIGEQFPDIDLAIMENGQYDANWSQIHTMPEQLGQAVAELGAKRFVTVHHSKFCLSNHPWDEPRQNERKAAEQFGLQLVTCQIGELVEL